MSVSYTANMGMLKIDGHQNPQNAYNDNFDKLDRGLWMKLTLSEDIDVGEVCIFDGFGEAALAQADTVAGSLVVGVCSESGLSGAERDIYYEGWIEKAGWGLDPTPGSNIYYLSQSTPGAITNVKPGSGYIVEIGIAKSATVLKLTLQAYLSTSVTGGAHDTLSNLAWSVAGHTMDTTLAMGGFSITGVNDIQVTTISERVASAGILFNNNLDINAKIDLDYSVTPAGGADSIANTYDMRFQNTNLGSYWVYGNVYNSFLDGTLATTGRASGFYSRMNANTSGALGIISGFTSEIYLNSGSSGAISAIRNMYIPGGVRDGSASSVVTNNSQLYIESPAISSTNAYGIVIENVSTGSSLNYALKTGTGLVYHNDAMQITGNFTGTNADFASGDVIVGNYSGLAATLSLKTVAGYDSILNLKEASDNYGFSVRYDGGTDTFEIRRHLNSADGSAVITAYRANDNVLFAGASSHVGGILTNTIGEYGAGSGVTISNALTQNGGAIFNEAGGDFDFRVEGDTSTHLIFAEAGEDRVGINESDPDAMLHVTAGAGEQGFICEVQSRYAGWYLKDNLGNTPMSCYVDDADLGGTILLLSDAATVRIALDTDGNTYFNGGNVGINDSTPSYKLDVNGDFRAVGIMYANDAIYLTQTDGAERIDSDADGYGDAYAGTAWRFHAPIYVDTINELTATAGVTFGNLASFSKTIALGENSPSTVTGDTDDWAPGAYGLIRVESDGVYNITGMVAGAGGQMCVILNTTANPLTFMDEDASSAEANRFHSTDGSDIQLLNGEMMFCIYDTTSDRWRISKL